MSAGMEVDGFLPPSTVEGAGQRDWGIYIHIPFCSVRCGYCDFNTYTATELGPGASQPEYAGSAIAEIDLAARAMAGANMPPREVSTVFFGGGTPTLLPTADLIAMLAAVRSHWGLAEGVEITTEANPDSVTQADLEALAAAGFTRVSFGMQSAVPHVLATLERTHDPERVPVVVEWARRAGLAVSLDLIYGTPGESLADWRTSLQTAIGIGPDHISAYALVVEPGTKMGAQVRRGILPTPDDDDEADKYELADAMLAGAGYDWYEISNFSRGQGQRCRHNMAYWRSQDWWGIGPGAHSHVGGQRWWNVKHPRPYAALVNAGKLPVGGAEVLSATQREEEHLMLQIRLRDGYQVPARHERKLIELAESGLIYGEPAQTGLAVLTQRGRLLADTVIGALVD